MKKFIRHDLLARLAGDGGTARAGPVPGGSACIELFPPRLLFAARRLQEALDRQAVARKIREEGKCR